MSYKWSVQWSNVHMQQNVGSQTITSKITWVPREDTGIWSSSVTADGFRKIINFSIRGASDIAIVSTWTTKERLKEMQMYYYCKQTTCFPNRCHDFWCLCATAISKSKGEIRAKIIIMTEFAQSKISQKRMMMMIKLRFHFYFL